MLPMPTSCSTTSFGMSVSSQLYFLSGGNSRAGNHVEQEETVDFGYFLWEREEGELASAAFKLNAISSDFTDYEYRSESDLNDEDSDWRLSPFE